MGQDHPEKNPKKITNRDRKNSKFLEELVRDPRLIQRIIFIPQLFAGTIDSDIKKVQRLIQTLPIHPLQVHITDSINERFENIKQKKVTELSPNTVKKETQIQTKNFETSNEQETIKNFYELETQEKFLQLLKKFQHWFYIQKQLITGLLAKSNKKMTIRKKVLVNYQSLLDKNLYSKLYLKYYLIILKKNLASKDKQCKSYMVDFHNSIGKMICQMIENNHFNEKKLFQLCYKIIYLEKEDTKSKLKLILNQIKEEFKPLYLTKEHSLLLKPSQFDRLRQVSRLYLDELYLRSLKQAEDPQIIVDSNDGFGIVRSFPIIRVRQDRNK